MGTVIKNGIAITELNPNKGGGGGGSMETIMSTGAADTPQGVVWHDGEGVEITGTLVPSQNTTNKLYFVPAEGQGEDMFDEYITLLADGDYVWERFGSAISVIADIIYGYMNGGIFYKTKNGASYTEPIVPEINRQYTDKDTGIPYIWDGASYMPLNKKPYLSLERLRPYLYRVTFDSLPEDGGGESPVLGACSAFVQDGRLYRNLDFKYDEAASFIVRTRDFEGMSFITGLNDGQMNDSLIAQLPYRIVDGRNNSGIMVSTHVLYNDWEWTGAGNRNISLTRLPFEVLTRVKSMATITTDLDGILGNLYASEGLQAMEYLLQVLVTDGTTTYAILPPTSEGEAFVLQDITSNPKLTNFRWLAQAEVSRFDMDMQDRPTGIERFNLMPCELSELRFTKAYETPSRLSEFIGIRETTKASTDAELEAIYDDARALYLDRERDGQTWQTMHSVVYGNGMENLWIQENWDDNCIASPASAAAALLIQSESDVTIEGFSVPALTAEQVTQAYNAVVAGRGCIIVDRNDNGHFYVNQADALNDEVTIEILFYNTMLVTYTVVDDDVEVVGSKIGSEETIEITLTGDSGTLTSSQIADIISNKNVVLVNGGRIFTLSNKLSTLSYRTYMSLDAAISNGLTAETIYIQIDSTAVNYGAWTKEDVDLSVSKPIANTIPTGGMLPDVMYALGTISIDPNVTISNPSDGKDHEWMLTFSIGATAPASVTFPSNVQFPDTATFEANKHYEVSMKWDANDSKYYGLIQTW